MVDLKAPPAKTYLWLRLAGLIVLSTGVLAASSEAGSAGRIGFFDLSAVYRQTGIQLAARKEWQAQLRRREQALDALAKEIEDLRVELRLHGAALSAEERATKEEAIAKKFEELVRDKERHQKELLQLEPTIRARVTRIVSDAVKVVGEKQGYAAVFERGQAGLYYVNQEVDLTEAVVQQVKEKMISDMPGAAGTDASPSPGSSPGHKPSE